jgi:hypothetical protein
MNEVVNGFFKSKVKSQNLKVFLVSRKGAQGAKGAKARLVKYYQS